VLGRDIEPGLQAGRAAAPHGRGGLPAVGELLQRAEHQLDRFGIGRRRGRLSRLGISLGLMLGRFRRRRLVD